MPHIETQQGHIAIHNSLKVGEISVFWCSLRIKKINYNAGKLKDSDNQEKLAYQMIEDVELRYLTESNLL
jgi:hypothetical protein